MSVMAVMKYLFPRPLPLWHAAAAVVTGHMPLLLIPRLLLPAESLLLFTGICLLFLIRTRLSFFIRIVAGTFLAVNIHIGNTLSLFSAELPDNCSAARNSALSGAKFCTARNGEISAFCTVQN